MQNKKTRKKIIALAVIWMIYLLFALPYASAHAQAMQARREGLPVGLAAEGRLLAPLPENDSAPAPLAPLPEDDNQPELPPQELSSVPEESDLTSSFPTTLEEGGAPGLSEVLPPSKTTLPEPPSSPAPTPEQDMALPPLLTEESQDDPALPVQTDALETQGRALGPSAMVVYTYDALKQALSQDNGLDTIYLGADIAADATGIVIHPQKTALTISGQAPDSAERYTFTQWGSAAFANTIRLELGSALRQVTLRDMYINGKNYYGVVAVNDALKGVEIIHDNIRYTGPQPIYNRNGSARIIDSTYTLQQAGGVGVQELAEVVDIAFAGNVSVQVGQSGYSVVWLTQRNSTVTLAENAAVSIDAQNYFIFTSADANVPTVSLQSGAKLQVKSQNGFTYANQKVGNVYIGPHATLDIQQHSAQSQAALRVAGTLEAKQGSNITIVRTGTDGVALRFTDAEGRADFQQPERVFLYSSAGVPLRFTGNGSLSVTSSALNLWAASSWAPHDGVDAHPSHIWNKAGGEELTLYAAFNTSTLRSISHNLTQDDPIVSPLDAASFNLEKHQLLAFGHMELALDTVYVQHGVASGTTEPGAAVKVFSAAPGEAENSARTSADGAGKYSLPIDTWGLTAGSTLYAIASYNRLQMRQQSALQGDPGGPQDGRLAFLHVPDEMGFGSLPIPSAQQRIAQREQAFVISVGDNRLYPGAWRLDASLASPLAANGVEAPSLANAIVFADASGQAIALSTDPLTIHRELTGAGGSYDIRWSAQEGILLQIAPGEVYSDLDYQATIQWSLVDAP